LLSAWYAFGDDRGLINASACDDKRPGRVRGTAVPADKGRGRAKIGGSTWGVPAPPLGLGDPHGTLHVQCVGFDLWLVRRLWYEWQHESFQGT